MDLLTYIISSSLEYLSFFIFLIAQFRFSLKENLSQITLISLLLAFVSYSLINADLNGVLPLIQFIFVLFYIYLYMKVSILNALIKFFTGYIVYGLAQTCIIAAAMHLELVQDKIEAGTRDGYYIQITTVLVILLFSYLIVLLKGGLSFIEARSRFSRKSITGTNKLFIVFIVITFLVTIFTNMYFLGKDNPPLLEIAFVFLIFIVLLFYLSIRKDEGNDRGNLKSSSSKNERNQP